MFVESGGAVLVMDEEDAVRNGIVSKPNRVSALSMSELRDRLRGETRERSREALAAELDRRFKSLYRLRMKA
jgi:hypothetical protein